MPSRFPCLALLAALGALVLLSCGGHDKAKRGGSDTGAQPAAVKLVARAAGPNPRARSGRIDGEIEFTIKGVTGFSEPFSTTVSGPFAYRNGAPLPDYALELGVRNYGVTLTSVHGKSYVSVGTAAYELPAAVRARLVRTSKRGRNGLTRTLEQFGIAPWRWETEQRIAGTETLDGVRTTHIATSFNAGRIVKDADTLLGLMRALGVTRATGVPRMIGAGARRRFVRGVTSKVGGSWIGVADKVLRQSSFTMRFAIPQADRSRLAGMSGGSVVGRLTVTDVGKAQPIKVPATVGSFADFRRALDAVGDAQQAK